MRCTQFLEELGNYLDCEANEATRLEVEEHGRRCHKCWLLLDTCSKTVAVFRRQEPPELPAALHSQLMAAVQIYRRGAHR